MQRWSLLRTPILASSIAENEAEAAYPVTKTAVDEAMATADLANEINQLYLPKKSKVTTL